MTTTQTAHCSDCGHSLPLERDGLGCPACGGFRRTYNVHITVKVAVSANLKMAHEFFEADPIRYPLYTGLTAVGVVLSFFEPGAALLGIAITVCTYEIGKKAGKYVRREIP